MQPKPQANKKFKPTKPGKGSDPALKARASMIDEVNKASAKGKAVDLDGDGDSDVDEFCKGGMKGYAKGGKKK